MEIKKIKNNTNFFNIVNAQPSTTISCVAAKIFAKKNTITNFSMSGFRVSGNHSSILLPIKMKHAPVEHNSRVLNVLIRYPRTALHY